MDLLRCIFATFILCLQTSCSSAAQSFAFVKDAKDVVLDAQVYDYIVVGGGTAGCPLAATLSRDFKVLVLERGGSPYNNPNCMQRDRFGINRADTSPNSTLQLFVSTDGVSNGRGRVLGGGTSVNAGFYSRAEQCFIDLLGLDECLVGDSYLWVERVVASVPQQLGPYQSVVRASLLEAAVTPDNGASYEHLVGTKTGATIFTENGTRRPASDLLVYANSSNILVLLHATASRILFTAGQVARGVEYMDSSGQKHTALLNSDSHSEVIVSAGALGSPQLLMLSGIGPRDHLESSGIQVLVDAPEVGKFMGDNPTTFTAVPSPSFVESGLAQVVGITSFGSYVESGSGEALVPNAPSPIGIILQKTNGPFSRGELRLNTTDVTVNPIVTFNYFKVQRDLDVCIGGVSVVEEMILSNAYKAYRFDNQAMPSGGTAASPDRRNSTVSADTIKNRLADYCRNNVATIYHAHGGCLVDKVVDSEYRVMGAHGLRVLDGSTFVISPGTNPQATLMMLGRYVGVKMIEKRTGVSLVC